MKSSATTYRYCVCEMKEKGFRLGFAQRRFLVGEELNTFSEVWPPSKGKKDPCALTES